MAFREIGATLTLDGEAEFKKALSDANREMRVLDSELKASQSEFAGQANSVDALRAKHETLIKKQQQQEEIVRALAKAVEESTKANGENDKKTEQLTIQYNNARAKLGNLNAEIKDNEQYLDEASNSADGCATSIDGYGKKVKQAGDEAKPASTKSALLDSALSKLNLSGITVGAAFGKLVSVFTNAIKRMAEMAVETNELRQNLAKLEVSAQTAGVALAADLTGMMTELAGIGVGFDEAAETLTNLFAAGITDGEQLAATVAAIEGAVIKYQNTLKSESLADSMQEFLASGELTGQFSELLNREGLLEPFTAALEDADAQADRLSLTLETMASSGLSELRDAYYETNEALVAYNESVARLELAQTAASEGMLPLLTTWNNIKAWFSENRFLNAAWPESTLNAAAKAAGVSFDEMRGYVVSASITLDEWSAAVKASGLTAEEYWQSIQTGSQTVATAADATAEYAAAVEAQVPSVEAALAALDELQAQYDAIRASVDSAVSGFTDMTDATAQYATTADDMIAALESQREYLASYRENLKLAADMGLSDALIEELSDGSAQSAAYLQAIVEGGEGAISDLNEQFAMVESGKEAFVETVAGLLPEFQTQLDEVTGALNDAVDDWNLYDEAATSGENTISGLTTALAGKKQTVMDLGREIGEAFMEGYNSAMGIASPSRRMAQAMDFTVQGAILEGQRRSKDMLTAGAQLGEAVAAGFSAASIMSSTGVSASGGSAAGGRTVTVNIYPQDLSSAQVDYLVRRIDTELGGRT